MPLDDRFGDTVWTIEKGLFKEEKQHSDDSESLELWLNIGVLLQG